MAMEFSSDLIEEILSWLPARSLERFRYTCKQWKTLITDPRFVKKHFSQMRAREQQFTVFNNVSDSLRSSTVSCVGIDFSNELNEQVFKPFDSLVYNTFHCDGLLLLAMASKFLIFNPLLKQARWIRFSSSFDHSIDTYGLGYISCNNDYKMVRFRCASYGYGRNVRLKETKVEIYEFKSDSWKVVVVDKTFDGFFRLPWSSVCLRGTPYWIGYYDHVFGGISFSIQSFDFSKERFEPLSLPPSSVGSINLQDSVSLGIFRGDHLSLLHESPLTGLIYIWAMMKNHWSKLMTFAIPEISLFPKRLSYFIENNGKLVLYAGNCDTGSVSIYIVGENRDCRKLEYYSCMNGISGDCYYVPSLLQVPGFSR